MMVINMEHSSLENHKNNLKYSPISEYLIQEVYRDNYMMTHHHRLLNVYVNYLKIFDSCIQ